MIADVGREHVQVGVPVYVAHREPHPRADLVDSHRLGHRREPHGPASGVVAVQVQAVAIVGEPQIGVAVVVVIEEERGVRLAGRLADAVAQPVSLGGIVALEALAGFGVLKRDGPARVVPHRDLLAPHPRGLAYLLEGHVPQVAVEHVVVAGVARGVERSEVVGPHVCDVYVQPAIAVHVGARRAGGGAYVDRAAERGLRDVGECAVAVVVKQAVSVALSLAWRSEVQPVGAASPRAHVKVLVAVVVQVAGDRAGAVAIHRHDARAPRYVGKRPIALVAVKPVGVLSLSRDVQVEVAVTIVVENHHSRAVVPHLVAVREGVRRHVYERRHVGRRLLGRDG